jgi:hypothetical protein
MDTSEFDALLASCRQSAGPVVIEAPNLAANELVRLANVLGTHKIVVRLLDGAHLDSKADLLRELAAELNFPGHFGNNWDAAIDCWSDLSWLPAKGYVTILLHADKLQAAGADAHDGFLTIANDVADRWHEHDPKLPFKLVRCAGAGTKKRGK